MTLPRYKRQYGLGDDARRLEDALAATLDPVLSQGILGGVLLTNISLAAGANTIDHTLGRRLKGWILADNTADSRVWSSTSSLPDKQLILNASAATTVALWVF